MTAFRAILVGVTIALVGLAQLMCCCVLSPAAKSLLGEEHRTAAVGCCHHHDHGHDPAPEQSGMPGPAEPDCTCDLSHTLAPLGSKPRVLDHTPAPECPIPALAPVEDCHVSITNWRPIWPEWESPGVGPPQIPLQMGVRLTV